MTMTCEVVACRVVLLLDTVGVSVVTGTERVLHKTSSDSIITAKDGEGREIRERPVTIEEDITILNQWKHSVIKDIQTST